MSGEKRSLTRQEFREIIGKHEDDVAILIDKIEENFKGPGDVIEIGCDLLDFVKKFNGDKEQIAALFSIFLFGLGVKDIAEGLKVKKSGQEQKPEKKGNGKIKN